MKAGILQFPGINCDRDLQKALEDGYGITTRFLWHTESFEATDDIYFVPGGFSYGDYLRTGALAAASASLKSLKAAAARGHLIVGICNGFQILTESHLLPGALVRNRSLRHICRWVDLRGEGAFMNLGGEKYALPVSHGEGNYICDEKTLNELKENDRIILKYRGNPNGSKEDIAGISNATGKVIGLMPHPERAIVPAADWPIGLDSPGRVFFDCLFQLLT